MAYLPFDILIVLRLALRLLAWWKRRNPRRPRHKAWPTAPQHQRFHVAAYIEQLKSNRY